MLTRSALFLFGLALVASIVTPSLKADEWNKKTVITLSEPVQIPACCNADHIIVLQPGKYVLQLVDSLSDRHIVRVFQEDGTTVITTILAIPNTRLKPTGHTVIQFWETPAGSPPALRAWFYPGDNFGQEFAYEKPRSLEIAKAVNEPVPAVETEVNSEAELKSAPVVVVEASGEEKPVEVETATAEEPAAAEQEVAEAKPAPAELPATGSEYPLLALVGIGSLMVSAFMSRRSKRA